MRWLFVSSFLMIAAIAVAQHCPWDCSGLLLLKTEVAKGNIYKLEPVLVDGKKEIIIDTIYGTGKATYDTCNVLYYEDFLTYRTKKISLHYWYANDTVYHFAAGYYIVKLNYCRYRDKKIYLRLADPYSRGIRYRYVEIADSALIHLHDHSREINGRQTEAIREAVKRAIIEMTCEKWMLREEDCK